MKLSKCKRGDSVHCKPGPAWGQSTDCKGTAPKNNEVERMFLKGFIRFLMVRHSQCNGHAHNQTNVKFHILQSQTDDLGIIPDSLDK